MLLNQEFRAGIYCRLSLDDGNLGDSSSIQTQKIMLEKYCKEQGFNIANFYIDDGYSGLNFNRPSFQRLLNDIENNKINLVITKDLSRLGRDYIQTGYYTEIYFQSKGIRYIAINDGVDTFKENNDIAPFKNILNDMYSKDLSKKVKSAKRQRAMQGMFISAQTPFGYKKDPNNHNQLIIDLDAAKTVKLIFRLALDGKGSVAISKYLTNHKIIKPSAHKVNQGDTRFNHLITDEDSKYEWTYVTVQKILSDIVYLGDMENAKYHIPNYKTKKRVPLPKDRHIIVQNTHEPIISRDDFDRVQTLIQERNYPAKHNHENLFKGLVFCKYCGRRLALQVAKNKSGTPRIYYKCTQHYTNKNECPYSNNIMYPDIKKVVLSKLQSLFDLLKNDNELIKLIEQRLTENDSSINFEKEKLKIEKRLSIIDKLIKKVYEDYVTEEISVNNYSKLIKDYEK